MNQPRNNFSILPLWLVCVSLTVCLAAEVTIGPVTGPVQELWATPETSSGKSSQSSSTTTQSSSAYGQNMSEAEAREYISGMLDLAKSSFETHLDALREAGVDVAEAEKVLDVLMAADKINKYTNQLLDELKAGNTLAQAVGAVMVQIMKDDGAELMKVLGKKVGEKLLEITAKELSGKVLAIASQASGALTILEISYDAGKWGVYAVVDSLPDDWKEKMANSKTGQALEHASATIDYWVFENPKQVAKEFAGYAETAGQKIIDTFAASWDYIVGNETEIKNPSLPPKGEAYTAIEDCGQMKRYLTDAILAQAAEGNGRSLPDGYRVASQSEFTALVGEMRGGVWPFVYDLVSYSSSTHGFRSQFLDGGLEGKIFLGPDGEIVLAFAGEDIGGNAYEYAQKLLDSLIARNPGRKIRVVGHSEGGALATYAALHSTYLQLGDVETTTFNSVGLSSNRALPKGVSAEALREARNRITEFHVADEYSRKGQGNMLDWGYHQYTLTNNTQSKGEYMHNSVVLINRMQAEYDRHCGGESPEKDDDGGEDGGSGEAAGKPVTGGSGGDATSQPLPGDKSPERFNEQLCKQMLAWIRDIQLTQAAYKDYEGIPDGYYSISQEEFEELIVAGMRDNYGEAKLKYDPSTGHFEGADGLEGSLLVSEDGEIVLAFAGTDFTSWDDIGTDIAQASGKLPTQYRNASMMLYSILLKTQETQTQIKVVGHSLGGGLAAYATMMNNPSSRVKTTTLNPAGLNPKNANMGNYRDTFNITNIQVEGETLGRVNDFFSSVTSGETYLVTNYGEEEARKWGSIALPGMLGWGTITKKELIIGADLNAHRASVSEAYMWMDYENSGCMRETDGDDDNGGKSDGSSEDDESGSGEESGKEDDDGKSDGASEGGESGSGEESGKEDDDGKSDGASEGGESGSGGKSGEKDDDGIGGGEVGEPGDGDDGGGGEVVIDPPIDDFPYDPLPSIPELPDDPSLEEPGDGGNSDASGYRDNVGVPLPAAGWERATFIFSGEDLN